jgi:oxygen-independent coproporphyrinogen-3 oxidase
MPTSTTSRPADADLEPTERGPEGSALYVHLPFCAAKCHYCDFFSVPAAGQDVDAMVDAVLAEARLRAPRRPATVFFGGGTPSLLDRAQLARLLGGLDEITSYADSAVEVTLECNPESLDEDKARLLLDHGVRRLSIGFQSLDHDTLTLFGRVHDVEQSFRAYEAARRAGVRDLNVDLIYASPGHTTSAWRSALTRVLDLEPEHLSAYNLAFEEDTVFRRWLEKGTLAPLDEELELELLALTRELTSAAGLEAYEVSNYARPGRACRHNENYWANGEYVGIGPSAVGFVRGLRAGNLRGTTAYTEAVARQGHAREWTERLSPPERLGETWWLGLRRTRGVDPAEARTTAGVEERDDAALPTAEGLVEHGLLERAEGRYRLTDRGLPLADRVAREFLVGERP